MERKRVLTLDQFSKQVGSLTEEVLITHHGRFIARFTPLSSEESREMETTALETIVKEWSDV